MNTGTPRWIVVLGQWLLCGLAGALLGLAAGLLFDGTAHVPALWRLSAYGAVWGLVGGGLAGVVGWLYECARKGVRPGELILTAFGMCGAAVVGLLGSVWVGSHRLPVLSGFAWPFSVNPHFMAALASFSGSAAAAGVWGWRRRTRLVAAGHVALASLIVVGATYVVCLALFVPARERARSASCLSNVKAIGLELNMYAQDYDGRLPVCKTATDLVGVDYRKLAIVRARDGRYSRSLEFIGGGPFAPYAKNWLILFCPSDPANTDWRGRPILDRYPEPGISYEWNVAVAGRKVSSLPEAGWLLRDRAPWHNGSRNLVHPNGQAQREQRP